MLTWVGSRPKENWEKEEDPAWNSVNTNTDWVKEPSLWRRLRKNSQENRRQAGRTEARDRRCFRRKERPNHILMEDLLTKRQIRIFTARGEIRDLKIFIRQGWLGQGTRDSRRWGLESRGKDYPWPSNTLERVSDITHLKITFSFLYGPWFMDYPGLLWSFFSSLNLLVITSMIAST